MRKFLNNPLNIFIPIFCIILILIGVVLGYTYATYYENECSLNPLAYGVSKLNQLNSDEYFCHCSSTSGRIAPFWFNEAGVISPNK